LSMSRKLLGDWFHHEKMLRGGSHLRGRPGL